MGNIFINMKLNLADISSRLKKASTIKHSWASALRPMPPASSFWHPESQCCTEAILYWYRSKPVLDWAPLFSYRTGSGILIYSGTGLTRCRTVRHLKKFTTPCTSPHCKRLTGYTLHVNTADAGKGYPARPYCWW